LWGESNRSRLDPFSRLVEKVRELMAEPTIRSLIEERVGEFREMRWRGTLDWFKELTLCLLTANSSAESALKALEEVGHLIYQGGAEELEGALRKSGYRFPRSRAEYIVEARRLLPKLKGVIEDFQAPSEARRWLVENVRGLGWKEASHFLRNVGFLDVAILDRHILRVMTRLGLIDEDSASKTPRGRRYEDFEDLLRRVARRLGLPIGALDLYLWYSETGKVLK
jgi:N-glycosylase/DNA lyase